ncbi:ccb96769-4859-4cbc-ab0b-6ea05ccdeb07-CDS [Sclerotinia trifoliorum]|uniref:Ccb96769-4859-4cbc-ab0b-6ea05ccdeb07-CDS n=1 Tax=Sclerotinia trifoliorum TaxID=28548 RepID=A0A8H2VT74_9HELO|nr:ccb96769-4859-4cbc-ab0b-6ea05ccdeb07-CDS [Sclerotinia trifoliorum]
MHNTRARIIKVISGKRHRDCSNISPVSWHFKLWLIRLQIEVIGNLISVLSYLYIPQSRSCKHQSFIHSFSLHQSINSLSSSTRSSILISISYIHSFSIFKHHHGFHTPQNRCSPFPRRLLSS